MSNDKRVELIYADAPVSVVMHNNMMRIAFGVQVGQAPEGQEPEMDATHEIIMPLDGMLKLIGISQQVLDKLEEAGMVQRAPAEGAAVKPAVDAKPAKK